MKYHRKDLDPLKGSRRKQIRREYAIREQQSKKRASNLKFPIIGKKE